MPRPSRFETLGCWSRRRPGWPNLSRYEAFFTAFSLGVAVVNADGTLASVNLAGARMLGVDADAIRNLSLVEVLAPASEDTIQQMLLAAQHGKVFPELDVAVLRGTFAIGAAPVGDGGRGAILSFRDVTHARMLQAELRKTKDFLEQLVDQAARCDHRGGHEGPGDHLQQGR